MPRKPNKPDKTAQKGKGVIVEMDGNSSSARRARAERALKGNPRAEEILGRIDFREPTAAQLEVADRLEDRAKRALARHARAAA